MLSTILLIITVIIIAVMSSFVGMLLGVAYFSKHLDEILSVALTKTLAAKQNKTAENTDK